MKLINIGFGSLISDERLLAIVSADSAPIKRMIQDARERGMLVDATYGEKDQVGSPDGQRSCHSGSDHAGNCSRAHGDRGRAL